MGRFTKYLSILAVTAAALVAPSSVHAAPAAGTASSSSVATPSSVSGLTLSAVTATRDGGMYFAFKKATGDDYVMVKQKADKTFDSKFGGSGSVTIPGLGATLNANRLTVTADLNGRWWATVGRPTSTGDYAKVSTGTESSATVVSATYSHADFAAKCAAAYPTSSATSWMLQNPMFYAKRSGAWFTVMCSGTAANGSQVNPQNQNALIAVKNDLTIDSSISPIGLAEAHGSTATCQNASSIVSDPTGATGSPEVWVFRTEHNAVRAQNNNTCDMSYAANQVSGYDVLRISSTGTVTRTAIASAGDSTDAVFAGRLDPGGRFVLAGTSLADATKMVLTRIKTDGTLDTSIGTNGFRTVNIGAVPAGAAAVRASVMGMVTTASTVYLSVLLSDQPRTNFTCTNSGDVTFGWRTVMVSISDGLNSSFGTAGVGTRVSADMPESSICKFVYGGSSVSNTGVPRLVSASGTGFALHQWTTLSDATGGTEGGTGTGGYTKDTGGAPSKGSGGAVASRTDTKVYSRSLPAKTEDDTALTILTKKQAADLDLRSNTPKICVALTTSVLLVNPGRCSVSIIDEETKNVLRTLRTTVAASGAEVGSTLTTDEPIMFKQASTVLSATARGQVKALAEASANAKQIVVVGHAAALGDVSNYAYAISLARANAVKAALVKAGVKARIEVVALSYSQPLTEKKSEASQKRNRRVEVFIQE